MQLCKYLLVELVVIGCCQDELRPESSVACEDLNFNGKAVSCSPFGDECPPKMVLCNGLLYITPGIYVFIYFDVSLMFFFPTLLKHDVWRGRYGANTEGFADWWQIPVAHWEQPIGRQALRHGWWLHRTRIRQFDFDLLTLGKTYITYI